MSTFEWYNKIQKHFNQKGFEVFDFAGNSFAIAKDFGGKIVLINEEIAQIHNELSTAEWTERYNNEDDSVWNGFSVITNREGERFEIGEGAAYLTKEQLNEIHLLIQEYRLVYWAK